jgi:hypothetical protein
LTLTIKKEEERIISKGGNASLLYLPKEYFTPGEKVTSQLEIDPDGNLKMVLTKRLFNFTCDTIKTLVGNNATVEYDKTIADTRIFSATQGNITVNCTKSTRDLEPTYVTVSKHCDQIASSKEYQKLTDFLKELTTKNFDAYLEPEGDLDSLNIYKTPQRYQLKDAFEAIDALNATGRKIGFFLVIRFNSKKNSKDQIRTALRALEV